MGTEGTNPTARGGRWATVKALAVRVFGGMLARIGADEVDRRGGVQALIDIIKDWMN